MLDNNTDRMLFLIGTFLVAVMLIVIGVNGVTGTEDVVHEDGTVEEGSPGFMDSVGLLFSSAGVSDEEVEAGSEGSYVPPTEREDLYNPDYIENIGFSSYSTGGGAQSSATFNIATYNKGYVMPVEAGATYQIVREDMTNNRFGVGFAKSNPLSEPEAYAVESGWEDSQEIRVEVPAGMTYMVIYLNEGGIAVEDLPTLEIYKVRDGV